MLTALALILSYVEFLLPALPSLPGIKLGLANLVILFVLMKRGAKYAGMVQLSRILISSLLFAGLWSLPYSLSGGLLSLTVMWLLKRTKLFSVTGLSIAGGVTHNLGQLLIALIFVPGRAIALYAPILIVSGIVCGAILGIIVQILLIRLKSTNGNKIAHLS